MTTIDRRPPPPPPPPPPKVEAKPDAAISTGAADGAATKPAGPTGAPATGTPDAVAPAAKDPVLQNAAREVAQASDLAARNRVMSANQPAPAQAGPGSASPVRGLSGTGAPVAANSDEAPATTTAGSATAVDGPPQNATPPPSFVEKAASIDDMAARNTFVQEVAKAGGVADPKLSGLATLSPGAINDRANMARNMAGLLDKARTEGTPADVAEMSKRIEDRFGPGSIETFDKALETAAEAGPKPELGPFVEPDAAYSKALKEALTPTAREALVRDQMRGQTEALDAAYAKMPAADKAALDAKVQKEADRKGFMDGATQALKDLGTDVGNAASLAVDLATDSAAREKLGKDIETLTAALQNPETRGAVIDAIKSELGSGVVDALTNFSDNPAYNTGYLAATVASGGAIGRAVSVAGKAAKIGEIAKKAADVAKRVQVELPGPNQLNMGAPFKVRLASKTKANLSSPADITAGVTPKNLKAARNADVANPKAFVKGTTGDFFKKGAHVNVNVNGKPVEITLKGNDAGGIDFGNVNLNGATPNLKTLETAETAVRNRLATDRGFRDKLRSEIEAGLEAAGQKTSEQGQVAAAKRLLETLRRIDGLN